MRALQKATTPQLWALVGPTTQDALFHPTLKIERLGGSRADLLASLLDTIAILQHQANQNFARQTTALEQLDQSLDLHLQLRRETDTERGRSNIKSVMKARAQRTEGAAERARGWQAEVEARKPGTTKNAAYRRIASRENRTLDSVKKIVLRHLNTPTNARD